MNFSGFGLGSTEKKVTFAINHYAEFDNYYYLCYVPLHFNFQPNTL
jgi:hypothetical protein